MCDSRNHLVRVCFLLVNDFYLSMTWSMLSLIQGRLKPRAFNPSHRVAGMQRWRKKAGKYLIPLHVNILYCIMKAISH